MLMCRNYDEAIRLMQRATTVPKNTKVDYYNDVSYLYIDCKKQFPS
jgi:hypothetical protein